MFSFFKKRRRQRLRTQRFPSAWLTIIKHNVSIHIHLPELPHRTGTQLYPRLSEVLL
jgi:hypothetical protein